MPSVDDRVVQLRFENAQFEKGVSTSMNTLDKLDSKLKSGVSGTALLALGNAAKEVSKRFSVMEVAGITAVSNLANRVVNAATKIVSAVPKQIISGGKTRALNIEQAKFQLSGLNVLWEDIYDNIDKAVSGTAYGLDEAAKVASQLVASGVEYGSATSDMAHALRGISGVAAMTNSSYEEIGSIFTTVAGQGKLMTMQLRQLEARGLNVAAKLGEQLGKSEEQIRDMVTKGKINFLTFANAMDEAFGEHATKANETFTGALSNMKAALSRIGADFATPILDSTRDIFNALRLTFNAVRGLTRPFAENVFTQAFGNLTTSVSKMISKVSDSISGFTSSAPFKLFVDLISKDKIELPELSVGAYSDKVKELQNLLKALGIVEWDATGYFGTLTEQAVKNFQRMNGLVETGTVDLKTWSELFKESQEDLGSKLHTKLPELFFGAYSDKVRELQNLLKTLGLVSWDATGYFGPLTQEAVKSFQKTNGLVANGVVNLDTWLALLKETKSDLAAGEFLNFPDLFFGAYNDKVTELQKILKDRGLVDWDATGYFGSLTEKAIKDFQSANDLVVTGVVNLETWAALLGKTKEELVGEYTSNLAPAERVLKIFENLKAAILNVKSAFGVSGNAIKRAWNQIFPATGEGVLNRLLDGLERFSKKFLELSRNMKASSASNIYKTQRAFAGLFAVFSIGKQLFESVSKGIKKLITPLFKLGRSSNTILDFAARIGDALVGINNFVKESGYFDKAFESIVSWLLNAKDATILFFSELGRRLSQSTQFQNFVARWHDFVQSIQSLGSHVWERLVDLWGQLNEQAEKLGLTLPEIAAGGLMEGLLSALDWLFDKLTKIIDFISPAIDWVSTKIDGLIKIFESINLRNLIEGQGPLFGISFSEVFGTPTEIVNNLLNNIIALFGKTRDTVGPIVRSIIDGITGFVTSLDASAPVINTVSEIVSEASNVFNTVTDAFGTVTDVVDGAKETFGTVTEAVGTVTDAFGTVTDVVDGAKETFGSISGTISNAASDIENNLLPTQETVINFIDTTKEAVTSFGRSTKRYQKYYAAYRDPTEKHHSATREIEEETAAIEGATVVAEAAGDAFETMGNNAVSAGENTQNAFSWLSGINIQSIGTWLLDTGKNFAKYISTMTHGEISGAFSSIATLFGIVSLTKMFKSVTTVLDSSGKVLTGLGNSVAGIVKSITGGIKDVVTSVTDGFNNALKTVRRAQTAKILAALALVIGVIVGSIWLISRIPEDRLWTAVAIVGGIALYVAILTGVLTAMANKASDTSDYKGVAAMVISIGLVVLAVAGAIKLVDSIELSWALGGKLLILAAAVTGMVFVVKAIAKAGVKSLRSAIGSAILMLSFAASLFLLTKALEHLAKARFNGIADNLVVILMVLGMLSLVAQSVGKGGFGRALGLTLMIADIYLLVFALQFLAKVDTAKLLKAMPAFIGIVIAMGVMMAATQLAGKHAAGAGIGILAMSLSLLIVARALKKISAIPSDELDKAKGAIQGILALYALIIAASGLSKAGALLAAGATFILIAISINLLYFAIKNLTKLADSSESFDKARNTIYGLLGFFAAFELLSKWAKPGKMIATAIGFGSVLLAIFGVFLLMKHYNLNGDQMQAQANALITIIGAVLIVIAALDLIGAAEGSLKEIGIGLLVLDVVTLDLAALIWGIGKLVQLCGASSISVGITVLSRIAEFLKEYGVIFGIVIAAFVVLSTVLGTLINSGLGVALGEGFIAALAIVDILMINLEALFGSIGEIANKFGTDVIDKGIEVATKIGEGIGNFFGAISGQFQKKKLEGQGKGVESLSESLEKSTDGLTAFTDAVNGLDGSKVNDVSSLASAVETMSAAAKTYSPELAQTFSDALTTYGNSAAEFFTLMTESGVDAYKASKFAEAISTLSTIGMYGDASTFDAETFRSFIDAIHSYAISSLSILTIINGESFVIDEKKIKAIVQMGQDLASIYDSIPSTGGAWQKFFGEESLTTFSTDISNYVEAIKTVNTAIEGFEPDTEAWKHFVDIGADFAGFLDSLGYVFAGGVDHKQVSIIGAIVGTTSLETFAQDISDYVKGIVAVNDVLVSLTNETFYAGSGVGYLTKEKDYEWSGSWDMLVEVGQKMSELYKSLPGYLPEEDAGFFKRIANFLTRNKDGLSTFGEDLKDYILAMVKVNDEIIAAGLDPETLQTDALDAVRQVATDWTTIATDLDGVDTNKIRDLGLSLGGADTGFMLGFKNFYDTITIMDMSLISSAIEDMKAILISLNEMASADTTGIGNLSAVSNALGDLGTTFATAFSTGFLVNTTAFMGIGFDIVETIAEGMLENPDELTAASSSVAALGATAATDKGDLYQLVGTYLMMYMKAGMEVMGTNIYTAVYNMAGKGVSGANGKYTAYWWAGYYLARGLINGMKSQYGALYSAGAGMASKALQGVTDTAQERSPSKLTTLYGLYMGQGLANGLTDSEGTVVAAAEGMTKSMLSSLNSVVGYVYDLLSGALDYDMTIRPVVDLSQVRAGMQELGGMFGSNQYTMGSNMYVPKLAVGKLQNEDKAVGSKTEITNNFYVQKMDEGMVDYFVARVNSQLGAKV